MYMPGPKATLWLTAMSCCCAGPDFLWRIDKIEVDNTSVRQIKVMLHGLASQHRCHLLLCGGFQAYACVHSFLCVLPTLPATDELDVLQALEKWGNVVSLQQFEILLAQGEKAWTALNRNEVTAQFMQVRFFLSCSCRAPGWQLHLCLALQM